MNKKRNLLDELDIKGYTFDSSGTLDISIERIKNKVNNRIDSAFSERMLRNMRSKKKITLIAVAATLVMGITVFAASGLITSWFSSSSGIPDYDSLPSAEQVKKDIGHDAVLIESFENGYVFDNGNIINNNLTDENNNSVEKFKSVMFRYEKDGDVVNFSQDKYDSNMETVGDAVETIDGVDILYHSYTNKIVPIDYQMTDEDKKAEANGELVFSYGSSKVEIREVQSVLWSEDGIHYSLMQIDGKLSANELAEMAKEIIDK